MPWRWRRRRARGTVVRQREDGTRPVTGRLTGLVLKRLLSGLVTLFIVSVMVFAGTELLPGDVAEAILGQQATPEAVAAIRRELELDRPALVRNVDWLSGFLGGDLGRSLANGREMADLVSWRLRRSLTLAALAALIAILLAGGLGLIGALYEDRFTDKGMSRPPRWRSCRCRSSWSATCCSTCSR